MMKNFVPPPVFGRSYYPAWCLATLGLLTVLLLPLQVFAQELGIDKKAETQLKASLDYLGSQKQFSVETHNTIEDVLDFGQKVQLDFDAALTVQRPGKMRAERHGEVVDQVWYYDGASLTLHDTAQNYYARVQAPDNINEMLNFARESLGLMAPASDLLYVDAFPLMIQGVYLATHVGQVNLGGVQCDHFAFSRPDVDFQIWIPASGAPLPCKYVVTDKHGFGQPNTTVVMSNWNLKPEISDTDFSFTPPKSVNETEFMLLDSNSIFIQQEQPE